MTGAKLSESPAMTASFALVDAADAERLASFAKECFHDTYSPVCRASDVNAYMEEHLATATFHEALTASNSWVVTATLDGQWAGYAHCRLSQLPTGNVIIGHDRSHVMPMEIARFYVARAWHGRGLAQLLLTDVFTLAHTIKAPSVWLTTWQENARAVAFYQKQGFEVIGTSTFLMGTHLQDDYVMGRIASS